MKLKFIYTSSRSHEDIWKPLSLFNKTPGAGFIFSTSKNDKNPIVIIELEYASGYISEDGDIILDIFNRNLRSCAERVIGLEIKTSVNLHQWREHSFVLQDNFIFEHAPLSIKLNKNEKYLMISRVNVADHFHIGQILLNETSRAYEQIKYDLSFCRFLKRYSMLSNSQIFQDFFALYNCGFSKNYFLEFGANDGVTLSNTILLESLGWDGIIGEALSRLYLAAKHSRNCIVEEGALGRKSGIELEFYDQNLISSSVCYADNDMHAKKRREGVLTRVKATRLDEILKKYNAPNSIGFFSLDVEGAEVEVLESFPFDEYFVVCAAVEHNYSSQEKIIDQIMQENGFKRVLIDFSGHDGFYVNERHVTPEWKLSHFLQKKTNVHVEKLLSNIDKLWGPV